MPTFEHIPLLLAFAILLSLITGTQVNAQVAPLTWMKDSQAKLEKELIAKYGEAQLPRIRQGLRQVAGFWRTDDGNATVFEDLSEQISPASKQLSMYCLTVSSICWNN
jgi:hypothetical protein